MSSLKSFTQWSEILGFNCYQARKRIVDIFLKAKEKGYLISSLTKEQSLELYRAVIDPNFRELEAD